MSAAFLLSFLLSVCVGIALFCLIISDTSLLLNHCWYVSEHISFVYRYESVLFSNFGYVPEHISFVYRYTSVLFSNLGYIAEHIYVVYRHTSVLLNNFGYVSEHVSFVYRYRSLLFTHCGYVPERVFLVYKHTSVLFNHFGYIPEHVLAACLSTRQSRIRCHVPVRHLYVTFLKDPFLIYYCVAHKYEAICSLFNAAPHRFIFSDPSRTPPLRQFSDLQFSNENIIIPCYRHRHFFAVEGVPYIKRTSHVSISVSTRMTLEWHEQRSSRDGPCLGRLERFVANTSAISGRANLYPPRRIQIRSPPHRTRVGHEPLICSKMCCRSWNKTWDGTRPLEVSKTSRVPTSQQT